MIYESHIEEEAEKKEWLSSNYSGNNCPNCNRNRLRLCNNKKQWYEKCYFVVEDKEYFKPDWET